MRGEVPVRRGQIAMFVILGLVLLLVVGLLFLVMGAQRDARSLQDRVEGTIALSDIALIDRHVGSCLDAVVRDELRIVGDTGALVKDGASAIVGFGDAQSRVGYGVIRNNAPSDNSVLPGAFSAPRYPDCGVGIWNSTTDPVSGRIFPAHSGGYFGDVQFPAACDRDGQNRPGATVSCQSYPGTPPETVGPSVQETLERNIAQRVAACASPTVFSSAIGRDVTRVGDAIANLTFLPNGFVVTLEYPLEIDGDVVLMTEPISRAYNVRLLGILQFASDLARAESRNITFRIDLDYRDLSSWKQGFNVRRSRDVSFTGGTIGDASGKADMVVITDAMSDLNGAAYPFRFLIEHRPPMIAPLSSQELTSIFIDGEPAQSPFAADPDDGPLSVDSSRVTAEVPAGGPVRVQVVVWDADCPVPYSDTTCPSGYDFLTLRDGVESTTPGCPITG